MTKLQLPCVVCATIIHAEDNIDPATAICALCRRRGKGPKMQRLRYCSNCGCKITAENARPRSKKCASCFLEWHRVNEEKKAQREQEAKAKAIAAAKADEEMTFPDTAVFGGYEWLHAAVNPVV